jgi:hypothetical protein
MLADLHDAIGRRVPPFILTGLVAVLVRWLADFDVVSPRTAGFVILVWLVIGALLVISAIVEVVSDLFE